MPTPKRPQKSSRDSSPAARHVGGNTFPDGKPVCKPTVSGRTPKGLSGPVHPGFPKPDSAYAKKAPPTFRKTPVVGETIHTADQNFDLYKPPRKKNKRP